jgi:prepilin-type N-terminal cleavage/methylation domain-containing protein
VKGFSLIEMLLAISIASLLAITGYRSLDGLLEARSQLQAHSQYWRELEQSFAWFDRDYHQAMPSGFKGDSGQAQWITLGENNVLSPVNYGLQQGQFKRNGADLLDAVQSLELSYWAQSNWASSYQAETPPDAIRLLIVTAKGERIERVFSAR